MIASTRDSTFDTSRRLGGEMEIALGSTRSVPIQLLPDELNGILRMLHAHRVEKGMHLLRELDFGVTG